MQTWQVISIGYRFRLANIDMRHETKEDKLRACDPAADDWDATDQWIGLKKIGQAKIRANA
ncbi:hypothetical protein SAMN04487897_103329 [Paenibacillus sp. yr247]|uniref:hypothetical protein n=1 Tax=Paenibacillus sp. yr247 TaxID=1761880 RepID=UPI000883B59B|nr:hypothetical protein [Paenibacillus sp. yr247]SDN60927.1 hypothetical protein SAMN04487897_103329 [Paenibacillus sp. yr247]